jgi:hypothetical protein
MGHRLDGKPVSAWGRHSCLPLKSKSSNAPLDMEPMVHDQPLVADIDKVFKALADLKKKLEDEN